MYSLNDACALFFVDASTLRRWCRRLGIDPFVSGGDHRRRFLSEQDVILLAREHNRVVIQPDLECLMRRIDSLERLVGM